MGAKTCMLVHAERDARQALAARPALDREATEALARRAFPREVLEPLADGSLLDTNPPDDELLVGCFPGVTVLSVREFGLDRPSLVPAHFLGLWAGGTTTVQAMHSAVDWFAFARWEGTALVRALSLSPDDGVLEDVGARLPFEAPFWAGERPAVEDDDEYPLPFHPLELGEAALLACFGYQLEGAPADWDFAPEDVPLARYRRHAARPWWRLWR